MTSSKIHFIEGLRLPLPMLVHQFFTTSRCILFTHVNIIRLLLGVAVMNGLHGIHIELKDILYVYTLKRHNLGKYYFGQCPTTVARCQLAQHEQEQTTREYHDIWRVGLSKGAHAQGIQDKHGPRVRSEMWSSGLIPHPFMSSILSFLFPD